MNEERLQNDFAEHMGPRVCLQDLICLKEEGVAWEGKIDSSMVTRIPGSGDKEDQQRGQEDEKVQGATVTSLS